MKEIFEKMIANQHLFESGMCSWAQAMYIKGALTYKEYAELRDYIRNNRPKKVMAMSVLTGFWFQPCDIKPRIDWINEQILKL